MNYNIASLLTNVYEIEGLLLVVSRHGDDTPSMVYERIKKAAHDLNEQCKQLTPEVVAQPESQPQASEPVVTPLEETVQEETVQEPPVTPVETPTQVPVEDREPDEDITFEFIYDNETPDGPVTPEEPENSEEPFALETQEVLVTPQEPVKNEVPAVDVQSMKQKFSINDYFRFRRELFQGDDMEFNRVLARVARMTSNTEINDFFYNYLEWDEDSEDVKDFMNIILKDF